MKFRFQLFVVLSIALAVLPAFADDPIPAREFFKRSLVKDVEISPDGEHAALTFEEGTEVRLAVMNIDDQEVVQGFEFGDNMHVLGFWWASNERIVMAVGEVTGSLDGSGRVSGWYAGSIDGSRRVQIFDGSNALYTMLNPLPDDERHVLIMRRFFADGGMPKVQMLDVFNGDLDYVGNQPVDDDLAGFLADNDGELRAAFALKQGDSLDDRELRLYLRDTGEEEWDEFNLDSARPAPNVNFLGFSKDNTKAYMYSDHDIAEDALGGVFEYDFRTEESKLLFRDEHVDPAGLLRGPGGEVIGAVTRQAQVEYFLFDDLQEGAEQSVRQFQGVLGAFPGQDVSITSRSEDGTKNIVYVRSDRNPGEYFVFDTRENQLQFLIAAMPNLPKDRLVPMEPIVVTARDGLELHGFITRPAEQKQNLPLIVNVHGGPFGPWDDWGYDMEAQFFAHHGYATLQINFRGSGNRGEDFQRKGWREWGGKMQDDVTDATRWAVEQGIADPDRICIYGGSYGGYATLMGVIKEPDLYQCGIGYVGVYDLPWFRSGDGNDFSSGIRREQRQRFEAFMSSAVGETADELIPVSPVHNVEKIKADLFIVHGGSDQRVVVDHAYRLRDELDKIGKDYKWMIKEEEGHGFFDVDNRVDMYTAMLDFLDQHIGKEAETAQVSKPEDAARSRLAARD